MKRKNTKLDVNYTSQKIATLMQDNQLTRTELADRLEITPNAITNLVHGRNMPGLETLFDLCQLFTLSITDIIRKTSDKK